MADLFPILSGLTLGALGVAFVVVSRPRVWNALDRKSIELNPVRRWGRRRWPVFDSQSVRLTRPILSGIGATLACLGTAILVARLLS